MSEDFFQHFPLVVEQFLLCFSALLAYLLANWMTPKRDGKRLKQEKEFKFLISFID